MYTALHDKTVMTDIGIPEAEVMKGGVAPLIMTIGELIVLEKVH